ncbi:MAG: hypothetical protein IBX63_12125 [Coriobacteriia bacterium]|nr:hypothetical protein [Coriobacteriia bacterium]
MSYRFLPLCLRSPARIAARSALAALLATSLLIAAPVQFVVSAAATSVFTVETVMRSEADVRAMWDMYKPLYSGSPYSVPPSTKSPYATGTVRPEFLQDGLRTLNFARYLAGLPHDVVLNSTRIDTAQHGAVLLAASNFSHTPDKPADMSQSFYDTGLVSTSVSNIGSGYKDLVSFQLGCLADNSSASNLLRVGHRRWLLNPDMMTTGMGFAEASSRYTTTYALDRSRSETVEYGAITWPSAGAFPVEYFGAKTPWSITLNPARYDWDTSGHKVTLRRISNNQTWTFTAKHTDTTGHFFNFDNRRIGVGNVFVFRPDPDSITYNPGDEFEITLSGGVYWKGTKSPANVTYRTRFMSLESPAVLSGPVAIQHDAGGVVFDRWVSGRSAAYSGGGYVYSRWKNVWLEARFSGSKITWIGPKQPNYGKAEVYIDGRLMGTVDQYAPKSSATISAKVWESPTIPEGQHTIRIRVLEQRNPSSTAEIVVLDRFDVTGSSAAASTVRLPESNTQAYFNGTWVRGNSSTYVAGGYNYSRWTGSRYTAIFTGTKVAWIGPRTGQYGRIDVYLDGKYQATVSQYGSTGWRYRVWESPTLARGTHKLELRVTGSKSASSAGYNIVVDALDVTP